MDDDRLTLLGDLREVVGEPFVVLERVLRLAAAVPFAAAISLLAAPAHGWPTKPVRIVVAYPTGGISDAVVRLMAEKLAPALGQPVVVENRAGAGGSIGMDAVAKATDGHTFGFASVSPLTLNPHVMKVPYDTLKDVAPVANVMYSPVYLLRRPRLTARPSPTFSRRPAPSRGG